MASITILNNLWAEVDGGEEEVQRLLRYRLPGYRFSPKYQDGVWDGYIKLTRKSQGRVRFPVGLLTYLLESPVGSRFPQPQSLNDLRVRPDRGDGRIYSPTQLVQLDPHQEAAVVAGCLAERGIVKYPTGVGKGRILGETVRRLNRPTLVLCDKKDLLHQLVREVSEATGEPAGIIGDGRWEVTPNAVVATIQALGRKLSPPTRWAEENPERADADVKYLREFLKSFEVVLVDEAHHITGPTFEEIMLAMPNAYWRLGYSATPFKDFRAGKKTDLGQYLRSQAWLGAPIADMTPLEGVATGRIVPADVCIIHGCEPVFSPGFIRNYKTEVLEGLIQNTSRNQTIVNLLNKLQGQTIVLVNRIEHGLALAARTGAPFVQGSTRTKDRDELYGYFKDGDLNTIIIGKLGNEALDLPNVDNLILAAGGKADYIQIQRIGRAMRVSDGKSSATIFDFEDYGQYLPAHYRRRRRLYEREDAYTVVDLEHTDI